MKEPTTIVQNLPANESAKRAPMIGVKLEIPAKFERVFDAFTRGKFST